MAALSLPETFLSSSLSPNYSSMSFLRRHVQRLLLLPTFFFVSFGAARTAGQETGDCLPCSLANRANSFVRDIITPSALINYSLGNGT